jgi:hypothetical protein
MKLGYYKIYTEEIDNPIIQNEALTNEAVRKRFPFLPESASFVEKSIFIKSDFSLESWKNVNQDLCFIRVLS